MKTERTPEEIRRQDRYQDGTTPVRVLPWPRRGVDGVPEDAPDPPRMDEVWPGREMEWFGQPVRLLGAPPVWDGLLWRVSLFAPAGHPHFSPWPHLRPVPTKATLTITTDDPEAVREALKTLKGVGVEGGGHG